MSTTRLNPNEQLDANLLRNLDAADGQSDGVIDVTRGDVQQALSEAGVDDVEALDQWDGSRRDGRLDLAKVRVTQGSVSRRGGTSTGQFELTNLAPSRWSRNNTVFENRSSVESRARTYTAIVEARGPHMNRQLSAALGEAGNWRNMTRGEYNRHFEGGGYDRNSTPITGQVENLRALRAETTDPQLRAVADTYIDFLQHIDGATAYREPARSEQICRAAELLGEVNVAIAQLGPEHASLRSTLEQGAADFHTMLVHFPEIAELAVTRPGQVVNSADNQLAPYMVKTYFRLAEDLRRDTPRHDGTAEGSVGSYYHDIEIMAVWQRRMGDVHQRLQSGEFAPERFEGATRAEREQAALGAYQQAMEHAVRGSGRGMRQATRIMAESQFRAGRARSHFNRADDLITEGEGIVRDANQRLGQTERIYVNAEGSLMAAQTHVRNGDTDRARDTVEHIEREMGGVESELREVERMLTTARSRRGQADEVLTQGSRELRGSRVAATTVTNGRYGRRFQTQLSHLEVRHLELQRRYDDLRGRSGELRQDIVAAERRTATLGNQAEQMPDALRDVRADITRTDAEVANNRKREALDERYRDGRINLTEEVLAGVIRSFADENGEMSRLDLVGGGGFMARGSIGVVQGNVQARAFLTAGIDVRRGDTDGVELGVDVELLAAAGVEVEFLFGLIGVGGEVEYRHGRRAALRFANERDAARGLAILMDQVITRVDSQLPADASDVLNGGIVRPQRGQNGQLPQPEYPVFSYTESRHELAGRAHVRAGIPGTLEARLTGEVRGTWTNRRFTNRSTGEVFNARTETTQVAGTFSVTWPSVAGGADDTESVAVEVRRTWETVAGDPNHYNNGENRITDITISMSGPALGTLAAGGSGVVRLIAELYGLPAEASEADVRRAAGESFEMIRDGITTQARAITTRTGGVVNTSAALRLSILEQRTGGTLEDPVYERQYTRATSTVVYSVGDTSTGPLTSMGGTFRVGASYTTVENIGDLVARNEAGLNFLGQNAATMEDEGDWNVFARRNRGAVEATLRLPIMRRRISESATIRIDGREVNARQWLDGLPGGRLSATGEHSWTNARAAFYQLAQQGIHRGDTQ